MTKPAKLAEIDGLATAVRNAMGRAPEVFGGSIRRQLAQMVAEFMRKGMAGHNVIHPGMAKMAKWGQCSERQARENYARLRRYGVVVPVQYEKGGRRATRFWISFEAIARLLVTTGCNPTTSLIGRLRDAGNPEVNPEVREEENPAEKPEGNPEATSAGIHIEGSLSQVRAASVVPLVRRRRHA